MIENETAPSEEVAELEEEVPQMITCSGGITLRPMTGGVRG